MYKSTTPPPIPIFPPELIPLFVEHLAPKNYDEPLDALQRRDLASCGLVSTSFYFPSRKHLFATVKLLIDPNARRSSKFELSDLLYVNPMLQKHVLHLVVEVLAETDEDTYTTLAEDGVFTEGEHLAHFMYLVPALRKLSMQSAYFRHVRYSGIFAWVLGNLQSLCPDFHRLRISKHLSVPLHFILQWNRVTDLELCDMSVIPGTLDSSAALDTSYPITVPPIRRLTVGDFVFYHDLLRRTLDLTQFRYLHLSSKYHPDDRNWGLLDNTFPVLNHLSLKDAFQFGSSDLRMPYTLCDNRFPALETLEIYEGEVMDQPWPRIVRTLMPNQGAFNIKHIKITMKSNRPLDLVDIFDKQRRRWKQADVAWTTPQYRNLTKVSIRYTFSFHSLESNMDSEKSIRLIEDCASRLLPRVSSSPAIGLEFFVKFRFMKKDLIVDWNNLTGILTNTPVTNPSI